MTLTQQITMTALVVSVLGLLVIVCFQQRSLRAIDKTLNVHSECIGAHNNSLEETAKALNSVADHLQLELAMKVAQCKKVEIE